MMKRTLTEALLAALLVIGVAHWIPSHHEIDVGFSIHGRNDLLQDRPEKLAPAILQTVQELDPLTASRTSGVCYTSDDAASFQCTFTLNRGGGRLSLLSLLTEALPSRLGIIPPETLDQRIERARSEITAAQTRIEQRRKSLEDISEDLPEARARKQKLSAELQKIDAEHATRSKQLKLIDEALTGGGDIERRALFSAKKESLENLIAELERESTALEAKITEVSTPLRQHEAWESESRQLQTKIEAAERDIDTWTVALDRSKDRSPLPDPDAYHLTLIPDTVGDRPIRTWAHLALSGPIAILLFCFTWGLRKLYRRSAVYRTAEEVVAETGLRLLGRVLEPR